MTREEVKSIVDKIQVYTQSFLITNNVYGLSLLFFLLGLFTFIPPINLNFLN